jgi:DUF1365 family protein
MRLVTVTAAVPTPVTYRVSVAHSRTERVRHSFRYWHSMWLLDLDAVPQLPRGLRWLGSFQARDHLGDAHGTLRGNVDAYLATEGIDLDGGVVLALTNARSLGYVFNPLSVYWCHGANGELAAVVAEVHNTHGERHCYLLRPDADGLDRVDKAFSVSPFFAVDGRYDIRCPEPGEQVDVSITLHRAGRAVFTARVSGTREKSPRSVLLQAMRRPLTSHRVMALIRFEGLRLWFRGVPIVARPVPVVQESRQ